MTRTGAFKTVGSGFALDRLRKGRAYHEATRVCSENIDRLRDSDPVASTAALAAIAYADAVTAAYSGRVNQKDHSTAPKFLRDSLGNSLPDNQLNNFKKLIGIKDEVQYGARKGRADAASGIVSSLDEFGAWVVSVLSARSVSLDD